jgi:hypothetical protein
VWAAASALEGALSDECDVRAMKLRFSMLDLLWLILLVAVNLGWYVNFKSMRDYYIAEDYRILVENMELHGENMRLKKDE